MSYSARISQQSQPANTYNPGQLMNLVQRSRSASENHLFSAADYVVRVLTSNQITYAIMGGFSLRLRGSTRPTYDIDIAVGGTMLTLMQVVSAQTR